MKYYIIAGEASGDLHGANLIHELRAQDPDASFRFWGGDKMSREAECQPVTHYTDMAIMGYIDVIKNLGKIKGFFRLCKSDITQWQPDCIIFIDYPGFNLRMAEWAHKNKFKTFYYIAPKVWAWKSGRVKALGKYVDKIFAIFPFEVDWFKGRGVESVKYVGNPLLDELGDEKPSHQRTKTIALVAGSRKMEVQHNLPVMIEAVKNFEDYQGVITGVDWLPRELYERIIGDNKHIRVEYGKTYEIMSSATAALVTSGTATLEAALHDLPQVVGYRGPSISMVIARMLLQGRIQWVSLVNIIMNRTVVNELIGNKVFTAKSATEELKKILPGGDQHQRLMEEYKELQEKLGGSGASKRCAQGIIAELNTK